MTVKQITPELLTLLPAVDVLFVSIRLCFRDSRGSPRRFTTSLLQIGGIIYLTTRVIGRRDGPTRRERGPEGSGVAGGALPQPASRGRDRRGVSVDVHPRMMPRQAILTLDSHLALSPMADRMRIAGAMDFSQSPTRIPERRVEAMKDSAKQVIGTWDRESAPWAGLRPVAPDGLQLIGCLAPDSNAFVATGYSMLGMTIAPAAGTLLADAIRSGDDGSSGPFSPQRFDRRCRS